MLNEKGQRAILVRIETSPEDLKGMLDAAGILNMQPCTVLELTMDYSLYGKITYILPRYETVVEDSDFGAAVRLRILMKDEHLPRFAKDLEELTSAQVFPHVLEKRYAHIAP